MPTAQATYEPPFPTREFRPAYYEAEQRRRDALDIASTCTTSDQGVAGLMAAALEIEEFIRAARTEN